jgi:hypothetical protein
MLVHGLLIEGVDVSCRNGSVGGSEVLGDNF